MYEPALPAAEVGVGLKAASRKLREAVGAAMALPVEAQDQVADAIQGVLQQLLLASRFQSLPADLLPTIARMAGRPARRACRLLGDAYGPLDCRLRLDGLDAAHELLVMAARHPRRFDHVTALVLTTTSPPEGVYPEGLLPALCKALPNLASLSAARRVPAADLARLASLAPRLTALTLLPSLGDIGAGVSSLLAPTGLRSLAIPLQLYMRSAREAAALSALRHLEALEWLENEAFASAAVWLPLLRVLSGLTSLLVQPVLQEWDHAAITTLRTAFPKLAALGLNLHLSDMEALGLSLRTALTTLQLQLTFVNQQVPDLRCLSTLQRLARLSLHAAPSSSVGRILEALRPAAALTSLHLGGYQPGDGAACELFAALAPGLREVSLNRTLFAAGMCPLHMACLTRVTKLKLLGVTLAAPPPDGTGGAPLGLGQMGSLEVLEMNPVTFDDSADGGANLQVVLKELAGLSRLRDLTLNAAATAAAHGARTHKGHFSCVRDVHLWQLLPLRHGLTRLVLGGGEGAAMPRNIEGTGLAVVGRLTRLRELALCGMSVMRSPCLHEYLLPLPASLRRLELEGDGVLPEVQASLQAAAREQDCVVRVGWWV